MVTYLDIQRLSTEDGPGLRTTVFFKGCTLKCAWCHNPESISFKKEIVCLEDRCMGCGLCESACPQNARIKSLTLRDKCVACGKCAIACPTAAIEVKGTEISVTELANELIKDRPYWGTDGGVTLSGGEAAAQTEATAELLRILHSRGVNTALDTCGEVKWEALEKMLPFTDLFLYDIKAFSPERHKYLTGADNLRILENAKKLHDSGAHMWLRTPIIPNATDDEENIRAIGAFIAEKLPHAERWELLSFNNLCRDKYMRLGLPFEYAETPLKTREEMERLTHVARESYPQAVWSGATKI